jgi:predicted CXXCH cytochrome family protein
MVVMASKTFCLSCMVIFIGIFAEIMPAVEKPTSLQKTCVTQECHADYGKKAFVHGPVGLGDCKSCHKSVDPSKHTWQLVREGKDLCSFCHLEQLAKKNVHEPLKTGNCTQCHNPHSSDGKFLLPKKTVSELCLNCHQVTEGLKFMHGPLAVGDCTICHQAHSSDHDHLLNNEPADLCFSCHTTTRSQLSKFEFVHEPVKNNCTGCHSGHGADNAMMLKGQMPQLCFSCHKDIQKVSLDSKVKHLAVIEQGACMNCHTPHASTIKYVLKADPATLCLSCHNKPVGISKDETLPSFTGQIENKKFPHGPVAQKDCKGCHVSHGSDHFRLLAKEYPSQFYAPFSISNYELCFSCHPQSLVLNKNTSNLTDFRNGELNLHFIHVNQPEKGRTCRSCHATHASDLPKHIRESVPYGMWNLPINFEKTEKGGSCKPGCHLPAGYDRDSAVVNQIKGENKPSEPATPKK